MAVDSIANDYNLAMQCKTDETFRLVCFPTENSYKVGKYPAQHAFKSSSHFC